MNVGSTARRTVLSGLVVCGTVVLCLVSLPMARLPAPIAAVEDEATGSASRRTVTDLRPPAVGSPAPDFRLFGLDGREYRLSSLRGRKVLLNFLCGCSRCTEFALDWERLHRGLPEIVVLGVSTFQASYLEEFRRATGVSFPILFDPGFTVAERYDSLECPRSWVIDEGGSVSYSTHRDTAPAVTIAALERHVVTRRPGARIPERT